MTTYQKIRAVSGWLALILSLAIIAANAALPAAGCRSFASQWSEETAAFIALTGLMLSGLLFAVMGRVLTIYRSENRIGWLMTALGVLLALNSALPNYMECAITPGSSLPFAELSAWLLMILATISILLLFVLLPVLYPTGDFISKGWKSAILISLSVPLFLTALAAIVPGPMTLNGVAGEMPIDNPFGLPFPWLRRLEPVLFSGIPLTAIAAILISIAAFITRFRRSSGDERQQFKWFAYFLMTVVFVHVAGFEVIGAVFYPPLFEHWSYGLMVAVSFNGFPLVIGLAIFKYRLYDIDLIIRRTLAYSILTALLALVYFSIVTLLQGLFATFSRQQSTVAVVISTLAIAALFNPLRLRLQDFIDRRFYRRGYDAQKTLESFAAQARSEVELSSLTNGLLRSIQDTLQPEKINLWIKKT
jgi:hypothetical protein